MRLARLGEKGDLKERQAIRAENRAAALAFSASSFELSRALFGWEIEDAIAAAHTAISSRRLYRRSLAWDERLPGAVTSEAIDLSPRHQQRGFPFVITTWGRIARMATWSRCRSYRKAISRRAIPARPYAGQRAVSLAGCRGTEEFSGDRVRSGSYPTRTTRRRISAGSGSSIGMVRRTGSRKRDLSYESRTGLALSQRAAPASLRRSAPRFSSERRLRPRPSKLGLALADLACRRRRRNSGCDRPAARLPRGSHLGRTLILSDLRRGARSPRSITRREFPRPITISGWLFSKGKPMNRSGAAKGPNSRKNYPKQTFGLDGTTKGRCRKAIEAQRRNLESARPVPRAYNLGLATPNMQALMRYIYARPRKKRLSAGITAWTALLETGESMKPLSSFAARCAQGRNAWAHHRGASRSISGQLEESSRCDARSPRSRIPRRPLNLARRFTIRDSTACRDRET